MRAVRNARVRGGTYSGRRALVRRSMLAAVLFVSVALGCRLGDAGSALTPPADAAAWDPEHAELFDDGLTLSPPRLDGRAPNDVLDQKLFQRRLGHADLVVLARVEQVWGRGRYEGRPQQFVEVELGQIWLGELARTTATRQILRVSVANDLPASLPGAVMILFVRWAPEQDPSFHHHLTLAHPEAIELIDAMIGHARAEGALGRKGSATRRERRKARRAAAESSADE